MASFLRLVSRHAERTEVKSTDAAPFAYFAGLSNPTSCLQSCQPNSRTTIWTCAACSSTCSTVAAGCWTSSQATSLRLRKPCQCKLAADAAVSTAASAICANAATRADPVCVRTATAATATATGRAAAANAAWPAILSAAYAAGVSCAATAYATGFLSTAWRSTGCLLRPAWSANDADATRATGCPSLSAGANVSATYADAAAECSNATAPGRLAALGGCTNEAEWTHERGSRKTRRAWSRPARSSNSSSSASAAARERAATASGRSFRDESRVRHDNQALGERGCDIASHADRRIYRSICGWYDRCPYWTCERSRH